MPVGGVIVEGGVYDFAGGNLALDSVDAVSPLMPIDQPAKRELPQSRKLALGEQ
jgi:hypothetical protein